MSFVTCQYCGQANADVTRICRYCGTELQHAAQRGPTYAETPSQQPGSPGTYASPHVWQSGSLPLAPDPLAQFVPAQNFHCPHCQTTQAPVVGRRMGTAGWVVFFALLISCFPLCFIGLFIKEEYSQCSWCRAPVS